MLRITLQPSARAFERQLEKLTNLIDIELVEHNGLLLSCAAGTDGMTVERSEGEVKITYEKKCEFFRGILTLLEHAGAKVAPRLIHSPRRPAPLAAGCHSLCRVLGPNARSSCAVPL